MLPIVIDNLNRLAEIRLAELTQTRLQLKQLKSESEALGDKDILMKKAELALAHLVNLVYEGSTVDLTKVLNYGLSAVYPRKVEAAVAQSIVGGRPSMKIGLADEGNEPVDIIEAHGGGLASILGFLIRVLLITATGKRRLLVLDESFAAVSSDLQESLSALMKSIVNDLGFQIILITHQEILASSADIKYTVAAPGVLVREDE